MIPKSSELALFFKTLDFKETTKEFFLISYYIYSIKNAISKAYFKWLLSGEYASGKTRRTDGFNCVWFFTPPPPSHMQDIQMNKDTVCMIAEQNYLWTVIKHEKFPPRGKVCEGHNMNSSSWVTLLSYKHTAIHVWFLWKYVGIPILYILWEHEVSDHKVLYGKGGYFLVWYSYSVAI